MDNLFIGSILLGLALAMFAQRKWRELEREMARRETAEQSLRKSDESYRQMEEYRNLFKLANDPILILDAGDGVVLDINDKACETYGFAREELIGRNVVDITRDPLRTRQRLDRVLSGAPLREFEGVHFRADGSAIDVVINSSLIEYQSHQAILSINRDITERKRAEVEQKRLQDERDELLEQLLSQAGPREV